MEMDWPTQHQQPQLQTVEMLQKPAALAFLGRRTMAPRPLSEATEIFDTDNEDDSADSSPRPWDSQGDDDSQSTLSSRDELPTPPHTGGLGGFEFHFDDKAVVGPQGPHLFRGSPDILDSPTEDTILLGMSPIGEPKPVQEVVLAPDPQPPEPHLQSYQKPPPPQTARPINALNTAVAELDESQVRDWTPRQVAEWMAEAGFETTVVEKFLIHDISGSVLLDLQFEDLKELDISSFGKRHRVMSSIHQLRNSSMITLEAPLSRTPSRNNRSPRALQRSGLPEEQRQVVVSPPDRSRSRRRVRHSSDVVTPAESISIVGIEQVLPKEHKCSKGEDCPKWQKQQRRILRMQKAFEEDNAITNRPVSDTRSEVLPPSIVGSSDVLGPSSVKITAESLSVVQPRDPQESVRQFLSFQHLHAPSPCGSSNPSPPPAASATYTAASKSANKSAHLAEHLRGLPKLTIPITQNQDEDPSRTPISALQQPTQIQVQLKAQLQRDPYHYGGVASPADIYRIDMPMSATDLPLTAMMADPCQRDVSQSVPPEMRYGATVEPVVGVGPAHDPIQRSASTQPAARSSTCTLPPRRHLRQQSFTPSVAPVRENDNTFTNNVTVATTQQVAARPSAHRHTEIDLANHQGWMRKRRTTRLLRHEWADNYCTLVGTKLSMHDTHYANARCLEDIDVDDFTLHAYSQASSSKLSAAFKKSLLGQGKLPNGDHSFAFSLIPETSSDHRGVIVKKRFDKATTKSHHFAVDSTKERVEWMRKLMLAKAMKKNDACQI